jgi:hypothetical protein
MSGSVSPLPKYAFMAWCLVKHMDNFTFYTAWNGRMVVNDELVKI